MIIGILGFITTVAFSAEQSDVLKAGIAKIDITPTKPVTLSGYGGRKGLSQGIHDPLSARAVAFEQNGKRLILVSTDILGFYDGTDEIIRKTITEACRLEPSELFLCAIHTHSAPTPTLDYSKGHTNNVEYTKSLERNLVTVVKNALSCAVPVQIGTGSGTSPVGINRREVVPGKEGKAIIRLGRNPNLLTDREVQVLKIAHTGTNDPDAVIFAYATHSTSLGGKNYIVSGDVHGLAEQFIEKYMGNGIIAPAFAGASGNVDPWFRVLPEFKTGNGWIPEPVLLGTMLGEEVVNTLNSIKKLSVNGPVKTAFKTMELPGKVSGEEQVSTNSITTSLNITVGRVGDIAFVGLGGEIFNEIGKAIKIASPFPTTFIITHCNGTIGYLPTQSSYAEGGYEVKCSRFAPTAAEKVIREVVQMLKEL
ncbi:MAG: neutral/alkaline non-lysosomal ceramidase N-terminal domain-containing protein [Kiritimatiellae bacterium]|nr:neutral/alkaline non-lysosomal ceramidase N-terminal domain-containing protein [Kiritimatiellia bacterium]MDD5521185.1 neutral/alkaline non-lysosomal ceramidase N-terminal domain-containing protein [Kiritimatiellia bacterium]